MKETNNRIEVRLPENYAGGTVEVVLREGQAVRQLDPMAPVKTKLSGVIGVPAEYLKKRVWTGQFTQERSCLTVNREEILLSLIINEDDEYLRGQIDGKLDFHPKFIEFGINTGKIWTPTELGMFCKMNRAFFPDREANMKLVTDLMNFTATVNNKIEKSARENGDRTDNFAQLVNSNLPPSFALRIPLFKGMGFEMLEVETCARIDGRAVAFALLSPEANHMMEGIRDKVIDTQLEQIREIAPNIAIIEV
jgi:hypothetical protein